MLGRNAEASFNQYFWEGKNELILYRTSCTYLFMWNKRFYLLLVKRS